VIYDTLKEVERVIKSTGIFQEDWISFGAEFTLGAKNTPFCIIKSGIGDIADHNVESTAYIMALFYDAEDIEKTVSDALRTVAREVNKIPGVDLDGYSTDNDIFEPFGIVADFVIAPPFGGFRLDINVQGVI